MDEFKSYRNNELKYYVFANVVVWFFLRNGDGIWLRIIEEISYLENINKILELSLVSVVTYIIIFVFDSLIPGNVKWKMAYWILPEPSEIVFEDLRKKDNDERFTYEQLQKKCRKIYKNIDECADEKKKYRVSKNKWYSLYLKYEKEDKIKSSKRDYIITRDLYISTIVILMICLVMYLKFSTNLIPNSFLCIVLLEMILLKIAVRLRGIRLCRNVLALHVVKKK